MDEPCANSVDGSQAVISRRRHPRPAPRGFHARGPSSEGRQPFPAAAETWRAFKRLTQIGFPKRFPVVQFPNLPLIVAFVAGEVARYTPGSIHAYARAVSYLALAVWAYLELTSGVNWFRRLLGLGYAISTAVHLAAALQSESR
jgi:hypothetical protein